MKAPRVSIVTVCLNGAALIAETIESVASQCVAGVEHIVVDGGSTDGTLDVLARYPDLKVVSGRDGGVYDAMNRGIAIARGEFVGLVHGDDLLLPGALAAVLERFDADDRPDVVSCGTSIFRSHGEEIVRLLPDGKQLSPESVAFGVPCLNARFFKRALFARIGGFRDEFQPTADREFLLRLITTQPRRAAIEAVVHGYRFHDRSGTLNHRWDTGPWLWQKHMDLTAILLDEARWPPNARRAFLDWRAIEGAKLLVDASRRLNFADLRCALDQIGKYDRFWPARLPPATRAWRRWRGHHSGL